MGGAWGLRLLVERFMEEFLGRFHEEWEGS